MAETITVSPDNPTHVVPVDALKHGAFIGLAFGEGISVTGGGTTMGFCDGHPIRSKEKIRSGFISGVRDY